MLFYLPRLLPSTDDWFDRDALPASLKELLTEIGRVYVPALLANAAAVEEGAASVTTQIDGRAWVQEPFPYQAKCLQWLRQQYVKLEGEDREFIDSLLSGTGIDLLFVKPGSVN